MMLKSHVPWRTGSKLHVTIYIGDDFIGHVNTPENASTIVRSVNLLPILEAKLEIAKTTLRSFIDDSIRGQLAQETLDELERP